MQTEHTPGPWIFSETNVGYGGGAHYGIYTEGNGYSVCTVPVCRDGYSDAEADMKRQRANARLIAAAPDMLKALLADDAADRLEDAIVNCTEGAEAIAEEYEVDGFVPETQVLLIREQARVLRMDAIAKARGTAVPS